MSRPFTWIVMAVALNAASCLSWLWIYVLIRQHLRTRHPVTYARLGFVRPPLGSADEEEAEIQAGFALSEYLRSGAWCELDDTRLAGLVKARRINFWICCATLAICSTTLLAGW